MKDPNNENGPHSNAVELEAKAVFGRLEEPLIVAPNLEARRGNSHVERRPVGDLSGNVSDQLTGATEMEVLYPRCSGIDVHKRFLVACLSIVQTNGHRHKELRQFSTMTSEILALKDWLKASGCRQIAMESTGVYWKPIFHLLEDEFEIVLVNAQHMKAVPGRKTDVKDAEWIADLLQHGLLKASFIPSSEQQAVRDLTRSRMTPTGCVYDFPTSSEGKLPNIVDAQKKRQYTPFKIETVTDFKRRNLPWKQSTTPPEPILDAC